MHKTIGRRVAMSLRPAETLAARPTLELPMATRPTATRPATTRSLAAVLAAGQAREATTAGFFGKADHKEKFRAALMKHKMDNAKAAAGKLTTAEIKELEKEFKKYEEAGWKEMADNAATKHLDSWKGQMARVEAQQKILRAQYGLGALHTFTKGREYTVAMPMRPDMDMIYHALARWPNMDFKRGTENAWRSMKDIYSHLEQSNYVVSQKQRQRQ